MVVAQDIAEGGELVDDFDVVAGQVHIGQHAAGAPPPPGHVDVPVVGDRGLRRKVARLQQIPHPAHRRAVGVEPFEDRLEVGRHADEEGSQQAARHAYPSAAPERRQQVIPYTESTAQQQTIPARLPQVIGDFRRLAAEQAKRGQHPVAEVVIGNGIATEPGIHGRVGGAGQDAVHEHQVHRLLSMVGRRVMGAHEGPAGESEQEDHFHRQHVAPVDGRLAPSPPLAQQRPAGSDAHGAQQEHGQPGAACLVAQQAKAVSDPQAPTRQQDAQDACAGIAAVRQEHQQPPRQRQRQQADQLHDKVPGQELSDHER